MRELLTKKYDEFYKKKLMNNKKVDMKKCFGIFTHMTEEEKLALYQVTRKECHRKEKINVVEIGSYLGASSSFFAAALKSDKKVSGKVYCIDTWNNDAMTEGNRDTYKEFMENTSEFTDIIQPVRGWSTEVAEQIKKSLNGQKIDIFFIDGGHDYDSVKKDWDTYGSLLSSTAIIICHDIGWAEGVQRVVKEDILDKAGEVKHLPNMWIGKIGGGKKDNSLTVYHRNWKEVVTRRILCIRTNTAEYYSEKYNEGICECYEKYCGTIAKIGKDETRNAVEKYIGEIKSDKKIVIPRLIVNITDSCSLRCRECSALIPEFISRENISADDCIKDLEKIFDAIDECIILEFIGGEPLLHPELDTMLLWAQQNNKVRMVEITTNGTIIPKEEILSIFQHEKMLMQISCYGRINDAKIAVLTEQLGKKEINYKLLEMNQWYAYGDSSKRNRSKHELKYSYWYCNDNRICRTLYKGKFFVCGRAAALYGIGKLQDDTSYLEIRNQDKISAEDLYNFYLKDYAEACDYCDISRDSLKIIKVAEQQ